MSKWEMVKWSEVVEIKNGRNQKAVEDRNGQYPIYGSGGVMGYANDYLCEEETVIIGRKGNINKPIYVSEKFWNVDTAFGLSTKKNILNSRFLYFFCVNFNFEKLNTTVTIPSLTKSNLLNISIPLPPLETQKQIAKTLDTAAELLAMCKQQLAELDNLIKSTFYDMFGDLAFNDKQWVTRALFEICKDNSDIKCGPFGTQLSKDEYQTSGVPLWGISQINTFFRSPTKEFLTEEKAISLEAYSIIPNDITMSRKGNVGKCALYPVDFPTGIMHSDLLRIRVNQEIVNSHFILHQLHLSGYIQNQIKLVSGGAIMAGINVTKLKHIMVHVPPFTLQNQFADIVIKIEEQKALVKKAIDETQYLFDSLMSEYF
ncbi:MAG: restriction endonuclease subunit S [Candidatus Cohnella colombiensis]|uniref:Restriction endonuclease subunit S n=1 Tax=Candidatus Cohnella colombiensis TaxID=3121368 RepID=A0AA95EZ49_9BACL|nr:MAG: restriction endonuclease subunit S [Cohnella sp.]